MNEQMNFDFMDLYEDDNVTVKLSRGEKVIIIKLLDSKAIIHIHEKHIEVMGESNHIFIISPSAANVIDIYP
jgi:hypothetical protein